MLEEAMAAAANLDLLNSLRPDHLQHFSVERNAPEVATAATELKHNGGWPPRSTRVDAVMRTRCANDAHALTAPDVLSFMRALATDYREVVLATVDQPKDIKRSRRKAELAKAGAALDGYLLLFQDQAPARSARYTVGQTLLQS